jgi:formylglycine-generating enzyme required for sulfatase activity
MSLTPFTRLIALIFCLAGMALAFWSCQKDDGATALPSHTIIANPLDSTMVLVPAGFAVFGNVPTGWGNYTLSSGEDTAWVDSFYIDRYEVTNQEYAVYLDSALALGLINLSSGNVFDAQNHLLIKTSSSECRIAYIESQTTFIPKIGYEQTPAVMVSWWGAGAFAAFYGQRLPTELEWEKAARGVSNLLGSVDGVGFGYIYPWGDQNPTPELANFGHSPGMGAPQLVTALSQGTSWYGALNMAGNVMEWTATSIGSNYRVLRGGSYLSSAADLRTPMRFFYDPVATFDSYGFRCVSDP